MQARQVDPQAAARAEQEFYASLELMPPAQAYQTLMRQGQSVIEARLQQAEFRANDRIDKRDYDAAARTDPVARQYQAQVEQILADERRMGRNPERETILDVLVGRETRAKARAAAPGQVRNGQRRINQQRTQPTGARSNVSPGGRRPAPGSREADEAALADAAARGLNLWDL
jgi:hypothetical protein